MTNVYSHAVVAPRPLDLRRLLLVGAGLPIIVAAVTYLLQSRFIVGERTVPGTTFGFACFVLEVGLMGVIVGSAMPHPLLRWLLYGWMMVLVDLLVGSAAVDLSNSYTVSKVLPSAALVAAQIGLAIVWGTLGTARWYWRMPVTIGLGTGLLGFWVLGVSGWSGQLMAGILVVQAITLTLMSVGLRVRGYRLIQLDASENAASPSSRRFQFGIRDVLVWTTVLAILLGLMRVAGMLVWVTFSDHPSLYFKSTVALLSAMVILFALWASLGQGHWLLRYSLLLGVLLGLGAAMGAASIYGKQFLDQWLSRQVSPYRFFDYDLYHWYEVGWWWIAWMFLSGGLLAASLMIFRTVGYRLVRSGTTSRRSVASAS
jgi:hypothetical protein